MKFDVAWKSLEENHKVDGFGGAEYRRVMAAWIAAGKPMRVVEFIAQEANKPAQPQKPVPPPAPKKEEKNDEKPKRIT